MISATGVTRRRRNTGGRVNNWHRDRNIIFQCQRVFVHGGGCILGGHHPRITLIKVYPPNFYPSSSIVLKSVVVEIYNIFTTIETFYYWDSFLKVILNCCVTMLTFFLKLQSKMPGNLGIKKRGSSVKNIEHIWRTAITLIFVILFLDHNSLVFFKLCSYEKNVNMGGKLLQSLWRRHIKGRSCLSTI